MIQANELRVGNLLNYDTAEGDVVTATIDWQDLKWISEDPKGFNLVHSPIHLTEEWLVKLGAEEIYKSKIHSTYYFDGLLYYFWYNEKRQYVACSGLIIECEFVHELQNLYFALRGEELTIKN